MFSGALVVDKPEGPTSHDIVAEARRALKTTRVGHTGTLDPIATGVLPLVIGQATRLSQFLIGGVKAYETKVVLGTATDTYDAHGEPMGLVTGEADVLAIDTEAIEAVVASFRGTFPQMPPPFSAKKVGGVRAYELARQGVAVETKPTSVTVHRLEIVERDGATLRLRVEASSGFYVRALAHDIGARLGCGAHLVALRRFRSGAFTLDRSVTLQTLRAGLDAVGSQVIPLEELLPDVPVFDLSESGTRKATHGNPIGPSDGRLRGAAIPAEGGLIRLFSAGARLLALARTTAGGTLQPVVVLS